MRVAIVGCGSIGQRHAANFAAGHAELLVHDTDRDRAEAVARQTGAQVASSLDALWDWSPAVVVVATPSFEHVAMAAAAARHGCDLFVEKPLGHAWEGVEDLVADAERRRLVTLVGCNMRFHPGPATVKRLLDDGAAGDVVAARIKTGSYLPGWRPGLDYRAGYSASREKGGGAILDCIHEIDLALWLLGPARLAASVVRPATAIGLDVDGLAELLLDHRSGAVSSVHLNFIQRDYRRGCEIVGTTGTITWDFAVPEVTVNRGIDVERHLLPASWAVNDMYRDEVQHFTDCVRERRQTMAPLQQGAAALAIALAARNAAGHGGCA
jgi:predicted dehydrogenase